MTIDGTPIGPATTDAAGNYSFSDVPEGTYTFTISNPGCALPRSLTRVVNGDETFNFTLTRRTDTYGHRCDLQPTAVGGGHHAGGAQRRRCLDRGGAAVPVLLLRNELHNGERVHATGT